MLTMCVQEDPVLDLVREVYRQRKNRALVRDAMPLARRAAKAVAAAVDKDENYNPALDVRVDWLRGLCKSMQMSPYGCPKAEGTDEAWVQFIMGDLPMDDPRISNS